MNIKRIAVPVDFSENCHEALRAGCDLAATYGAELHLVHVEEPWIAVAMASSEPYPTKRLDAALAEVSVPAAPGIAVQRSVRIGETVKELLKFLAEKEIDLVVMGSHGRTGLSHVLLGSIAEAIVRRAPCPVLIVRPRQPSGKLASVKEVHHPTEDGSMSNTLTTK